MADINERLKQAARAGCEVKMNALLSEPGCDALSKDEHGTTALMWAATFGREACVRVLLPISDMLVKDKTGMTALMCAGFGGHEGSVGLLLPVSEVLATCNRGMTASDWARNRNNKSVGQFIDAYVLAHAEKSTIEGAASPGTHRKQAALRV